MFLFRFPPCHLPSRPFCELPARAPTLPTAPRRIARAGARRRTPAPPSACPPPPLLWHVLEVKACPAPVRPVPVRVPHIWSPSPGTRAVGRLFSRIRRLSHRPSRTVRAVPSGPYRPARTVRPVPSGPYCPSRTARPVPSGPYRQARTVRPVPSGPYRQARTARPVPSGPYRPSRTVRPVPPGPYRQARTVRPVPSGPYRPSRTVRPVPSGPYRPSRTVRPVPSGPYRQARPLPSGVPAVPYRQALALALRVQKPSRRAGRSRLPVTFREGRRSGWPCVSARPVQGEGDALSPASYNAGVTQPSFHLCELILSDSTPAQHTSCSIHTRLTNPPH